MLQIKNPDAGNIFNECETELIKIQKILKGISKFEDQVPYLTRYAIIRSAGTIEIAFKTIVSTECEHGASVQIKNFLSKNFKSHALNLSYQHICDNLSHFDKSWSENFKKNLKSLASAEKWKSSLDSLIQLRNDFAHGGKPTPSFNDVFLYFKHARRIIILVEKVLLTK